ncbi:MAG: hypothetical protein E5V77_14250 [Mesorhizobium sp.]|nr:MAG: hypothetical protein E5V77_14250 [Mesorhizobium sp.]
MATSYDRRISAGRTTDRTPPARETHHALLRSGFELPNRIWTGLVQPRLLLKFNHVGVGQGRAGIKQAKELRSQPVAS